MPLWNDSIHFCNWTGIVCGLCHWRVVTLKLRSCGFSGSLFLETRNVPQVVGRLSRLRGLSLRTNSLSGEIPNEFGSLTKLQRIILDTNELTGEIPKFIGNHTSHVVLSGFENHFQGSIPDTLGQLSNLWYFNFPLNKLSGSLPQSFFNISSLEEIHLTKNKIGGILPSDISRRFLGLSALNLPLNKFSGPIPSLLSNATSLELLELDGNMFTESVPSFSRLQRLTWFSIKDNQLGNGRSSTKNRIPLSLLITIPIISVIFVLVLVVLLCWFFKCKNTLTKSTEDENSPRVSNQSLHEATDGFSSTNLIGSGNFSSVYKAILYPKNEPQVVAVKVLKLAVHGAGRSFIAECEVLRSIRHRNLVNVLTCCSSLDFLGIDFKALVCSCVFLYG
ncbi:hypothetical protein OSB04_014083 [Centaurea solstitialis]|uniref:Protein kinase domain-containing protein n=1 Tax=Centaurea solstitialis TaxID=347529 RepID=A0AA38TEH2_9ASTR|nr:hypothetical protein OSB04_014083 [Centaurea solstitialis]